MSTSHKGLSQPLAVDVEVSGDTLTVRLADGRSLAVPVEWYPRLANARPEERARWVLLGAGLGIHWPDLDEDISVDALLAGRRSNEGPLSFDRWMAARNH